MKNAAEIEASLPGLKTEDLHHIECEIRRLYRTRGERVIHDDAYGVWLEDDQTSAAAEVFAMLDGQEGKHANSQTR